MLEGTTATIDPLLQLETVAATPLNFTVLEPCDAPKLAPAMVTDVPHAPDVGDRLVIVGEASTVNATPFDATPFTVTITLPEVAPEGTVATIEVVVQLEIVAVVPLNLTVLEPWVEPKLVPVMVTDAPTKPEVGERLAMVGVGSRVNANPLLAIPFTVTTMLPVDAPAGTTATIDVALQLAMAAATPLNVTVLEPCVEPKPVPVIVTDAPTGAEAGETPLIAGGDKTVKAMPLDGSPAMVTTTFPEVAPEGTTATIDVALQLLTVAVFPLNVTVFVPCVAPKFVPVIVTVAPTSPEVGEMLVIVEVETMVPEPGPLSAGVKEMV
jgi:hypothetical protein